MELMEILGFHIHSILRRLIMNPFTESTVARPLADKEMTATRAAATKTRLPLIHGSHSSRSASRLRPARPFWRPVVGAIGLAAGLVLSGTAYAVDANAATQAQLESVRGIGPKTAQIIIEERVRGGKYESFDDLSERVKGIGPKKAATLQAAGLTVGAAGGGSAITAGVMPLASAGGAKSQAGSSALSGKSKSARKPAGKPVK
jgi:competence protein ComEA